MTQKEEPGGFGPHLTVDLWGCPQYILSNLQIHFDFLNELPTIIGMTKITQPYVFPYSGLVPADAGTTGFVVIAESHLSVHSFEHKQYTFVDIFSCNPFDTTKALQEIIARFGATDYDYQIVYRGRGFPKG